MLTYIGSSGEVIREESMNTYMEQFAEAELWIGRGQHGLESPSNTVSDENP
jgi:MerR family transcriptional regulator, light-induced transcriptional regulator